MKRKRLLALVVVLALLPPLLALMWPGPRMASRDLACYVFEEGRALDLCNMASREMKWTWMGHAMISPGYRMNFPAIKAIYCEAKLTQDDIPVLRFMKKRSLDWRLDSMTDNMIVLLETIQGIGDEPENSVYHPKNPEYVLRGGCEGAAR